MKTILYICLVLFLGACSPQNTNPPKVQASALVKNADSVVTGFTTEWEGESLSNGEYDFNCDCKKDSLKYGFSDKTVLAYFESYFDEKQEQYRNDSVDFCFRTCYFSVLDAYIGEVKKHPDEAHFRTLAKLSDKTLDMDGIEYYAYSISKIMNDKKIRPKFMDFVYQKAKNDSDFLYGVAYGLSYEKSDKQLIALKKTLINEGKKRKTLNKKVLDFLFTLANEEGCCCTRSSCEE